MNENAIQTGYDGELNFIKLLQNNNMKNIIRYNGTKTDIEKHIDISFVDNENRLITVDVKSSQTLYDSNFFIKKCRQIFTYKTQNPNTLSFTNGCLICKDLMYFAVECTDGFVIINRDKLIKYVAKRYYQLKQTKEILTENNFKTAIKDFSKMSTYLFYYIHPTTNMTNFPIMVNVFVNDLVTLNICKIYKYNDKNFKFNF